MDRVRFITHQGKQILFIDVTNCAAEEVVELVTEVQCIVTAQPPKSVLTLSDLTGARFSRSAVTRMKEVAVFDRPYVKRAAFVGAQSLPRVFYEALKTFSQREFRKFKTREEAMDWLVREET
jgi:hypothetical protein